MYTKKQKVPITVHRTEANFDKACEQAYHQALHEFGIDEYGHINNVENTQRSSSSLVVKFKTMEHVGCMTGQCFMYRFVAHVE